MALRKTLSVTDLSSMQVPQTEKEGYLEKEGGNVKSWRLRWFILQGKQLHYFKSRKDGKPAGTIDLHEAELVIVDDFYRKKKYEYLFQIKLPARTYNIIAPDFESRRSWVEALSRKVKTAAPLQTVPISGSNLKRSATANATLSTASNDSKKSAAQASVNATSDVTESSEDEDDVPEGLMPLKKAPAELRPVHQAIRERIISTKAVVEDLLYVNADKLLQVLKEALESINSLMSDCYYFVSLEEDEFRQQTVLKHSTAIELTFKRVLQTSKALAISQQTNQAPDVVQDARQDMQTAVYSLLSVMDQLRADNAAMESALASKEIAIPTTAATYRTSLMRASRNLEAAMDQLEKFSSSSSSESARGLSAPSPGGTARLSPSSALSATLIPAASLPPRSHSSPDLEGSSAGPVAALKLPPRTSSAPQNGQNSSQARIAKTSPLSLQPPATRPIQRASFFDSDLTSFDALDQILEAISAEMEFET